jgi:signal transduction histidine kinase
MNHQLRTPLNAIIGYSEILLDEMESDSDASHVSDLKIINSAGRHLMSLLSDVLYMPKIEAEDVDLSIRAVHLPQFLDEVASTCHNLVRANHNEFLVEYPHNIGTANIDDTKVRQILINLLSNSGKFTKNGKVRLSADHIDDGTVNQLIISVEDTGIGIPADVIDGLFTEFNRGSNDTWKSYEGTGLGLAVSRKLSQLMGGNISVSSECGRGSIFTVSLPLDHVKMPIAA